MKRFNVVVQAAGDGVLRGKTPAQIRAAINSFPARYVRDWNQWITATPNTRAEVFGAILRRWQATRPQSMRRDRSNASHPFPFLEDLLRRAAHPVATLAALDLRTIGNRTPAQQNAFDDLWTVFSDLAVTGSASSVGISKATLFVTDGRIGPALDSTVRSRLGVAQPRSSLEWLEILDQVSADLRRYERRYGSLRNAVPQRFRRFPLGRLVDMVLGPRERCR